VLLSLSHEYQKFNNCGPVSLGVVTTYFGVARTQFDVAPLVKGGEKDRNVSPSEMQAYLEQQGLRAIVRVNGKREQIQKLLAAGIPVILHQWLEKTGGELVGHYRVAQGYDTGTGTFVTSDPFTPPRKPYTYAEFERFWKPWNHRYIVAYRPEQEPAVRAALGADFDPNENHRLALAQAAIAVREASQDGTLWFNLGDERLAAGDAAGAVEAYDRARELGLTGTFAWYNFGPYEALFRTSAFQRMLELSNPVMKDGGTIEEVRYWRGKAYAALEQAENARTEFRAALQLNAGFAEARRALETLK
jgi:tetratricopeptide (TPR) repeat protein